MRMHFKNKIILLFTALIFVCMHVGAQLNYYVSSAGGGDGSSVSSPMNLSQIRSILSGISSSSSERNINVYFASGTYNMPSPGSTNAYFTFATSAANAAGLNVTFMPSSTNVSDSVIFDGGNSFIRFALVNGGSSSNKMNLTIKDRFVIKNFSTTSSSTTGERSLFTVMPYSSLNLNSVSVYNISSGQLPLIAVRGYGNFTARNSKISNIFATSSFLLSSYGYEYQSYTFDSCILENWTTTSSDGIVYFLNTSAGFYLYNSTIRNFTVSGTSSSRPMFNFSAANPQTVIAGNSFINNTAGYLIRYNSSDATRTHKMYNNTLSGNSVTRAVSVETGYVRVFNNTVFNSGSPYISNTNSYIINNIFAGDNEVNVGLIHSGAESSYIRNISYWNKIIYMNVAGVTGVSINDAFLSQFNTTLSTNAEPGKQVYLLKNISDHNHVILNQGTLQSYLTTSTGVTLTKDQLGNTRPSSPSDNLRMSLGAVDTMRYTLSTDKILLSLSYNSIQNVPPPIKTIELQDYILGYPINTTGNNSTFSIVESTNSSGVFSIASNTSLLTFTPPSDLSNIQSQYTVTYKVTNNAGNEVTGNVVIRLADSAYPPGYIDPKDFPQTCFDYMGAVTFTSNYRFNTYEANGNSDRRRLTGFSIPLVADLNQDGYAEIIGFGKTDDNNDAYDHYRYIYIYNGQTGKEITRLDLASAHFRHSSSWHPSPSAGVLVDADRDGIVELLIAFPGSGGETALQSRLVSYSIIPEGSSYRIKRNWISTVKHDDGLGSNFDIPTPQVCDLDGDGIPEVLVYNKVYDAVSGNLLFTIDKDYMGRNTQTVYSGDHYHAFPYIYDLDGDGIYDIAAGKKLYKITKPSGVFNVEEIILTNYTTDPMDGYTGVADIDGDGKPDIVTVRSLGTSGSSNILVTVWNPGFTGATANPYVVAQKTVTVTSRSPNTGSNSYVYIGDIDGYEQNGKRLPEIAVLTGSIRISTNEVHPNVASIPVASGGIPNSSSGTETGGSGVVFALTYDPNTSDLKYSFVLEHQDTSIDTGFTMFDFDNDGIKEICYRDMQYLRIIKPTIPYVDRNYTDDPSDGNNYKPDVIKFRTRLRSYTGFEYPVIADIDNDASAEMIVLGHPTASDRYYGFIYAVGNGTGDKFAPARPVWNQFMYDPFKINDDLTTPIGPARDRLMYKYKHEVRNDEGTIIKTINNYLPYNNTLGQIPYFTSLSNGTGQLGSFEPIIFLTEAYIVAETSADETKRPKIVTSGGNRIEITVGNKSTAKTDLSSNTPITVYEESITSSGYLKTVRLNNLGVTSAIKAGEEVRIKIPITNPYSVYYVRLGDDSGNAAGTAWAAWKFGTNNEGQGAGSSVSNPPADPARGIGKASRAYRDCDWTDQSVKVALVALNPDAVTTQEYGAVLINIFDNDEININDSSNPFPTQVAGFKMSNQYIRGSGPVAGTLTFSGNNVIYTHNGTIPPNNIDTFSYAFTYKPTGSGTAREFYANVYIYIMQPTNGGFGACYGENFTTKLKESPTGIRFLWNSNTSQIYPTGYTGGADSLTISFGSITTSKTYKVKPLLTLWNGDRIDFLPGDLTISPIGGTGSNAVMRWTGNIDRNWDDPRNWVLVNGNQESAVMYIPTSCVDVIIPSGLKNYPELTSPAECNKITMKDRAMIAGIQYLTYSNAQVELKLKPSERDRFVMWSAPLKDMYSGDYHFKNNGTPKWGDVYMNFFQMSNPDNPGAAVDNYFTATFKHLGTSLPSGQAFNLKMINTTANKDSIFIFPKNDGFYIAADAGNTRYPTSGSFSRTNSGRFISDDVKTTNKITPQGDIAGASYIQVVNPFMAYLKIRYFLQANSTKLEQSYKIWNGEVNTNPNAIGGDLVTIKPDLTNGNRYIIDNPQMISDLDLNGGLIAPLQSFFVKKVNPTSQVGTLEMNPSWTTTVNSANTGDYQLRADEQETNILYIRATQNKASSGAALFYHPESSPNYNTKEDAYKLFYSDAPVAVYTFTSSNDPLSVNSSNDFSSTATRIGIRVKEAGQVTFDFSGMSTFGHNVYLIDHAQNNKETDLQANPRYSFTVAKQSVNDKVIELNDRFSLRMQYTGIGVGNEEVTVNDDIEVLSRDGYISIRSSSVISGIQIFNIAGATIYSNEAKVDQVQISVERQQAYIVKAKVGNEYVVRKVFVK